MPPGHEYPIAPPPIAATPVESEKHAWLHKHPYLTTSIALASIILFALLIASARSGVSSSQQGTNWVGAGGVFFTGGRNLRQAERQSAEQVIKNESPETQLGYIPITPPSADGFEGDDGGDLSKLLALISQSVSGNNSALATSSGESAFSLIPQGLISIETYGKKLTPEQEALHTYGNEAGAILQSYESMHPNASQPLKDHAEDRQNADKARLVEQLGFDMALLGRELTSIEVVPAAIKAAHEAYATTYRIVGTNLTKVAGAKTDEEYLAAIEAYNQSVDSLSKRFFALVTLFGAHEVTFSQSETGSVFVFSQSFSF